MWLTVKSDFSKFCMNLGSVYGYEPFQEIIGQINAPIYCFRVIKMSQNGFVTIRRELNFLQLLD